MSKDPYLAGIRGRIAPHGDRYTVERSTLHDERWCLFEAGAVLATFASEAKARSIAYAVNLYDSGAYDALEERVADLRADLALVRVGFESAVKELHVTGDGERPTVAVEDRLEELRTTAAGLDVIADNLEHGGRPHSALKARSDADALREAADNLRAEAGLS